MAASMAPKVRRRERKPSREASIEKLRLRSPSREAPPRHSRCPFALSPPGTLSPYVSWQAPEKKKLTPRQRRRLQKAQMGF